jgi:hypothetical protein
MATVGEARLVISALDRTGAAFASVEDRVKALEKHVGGVAKAIDTVDQVARSVAPVSARMNSVAEQVMKVTSATRAMAAEQAKWQTASERLAAVKGLEAAFEKADAQMTRAKANMRDLWTEISGSAAPTAQMQSNYRQAGEALNRANMEFERQKAMLGEARASFEEIAGPIDSVAAAQARLAAEIERANAAMAAQGRVAARASEELAAAVRREETSQRRKSALAHQFANEVLPFAGPVLLEGTKGAFEAGATVQDRIAQLKAAGASDDEIARARGDFGAFSGTHAGVLEADYLAGYKDARVIAPGEAYEMAQLGARYRAALRNSGISSSENDVGNVMRIMDELGLKSMGDREGFLDHFLKSQQAFGDQIKTETALAAYRNAKQSIYGWSPEFRDKYFPTLLQSSGQQGGTEMMTALNNYIGQHMQLSELKALIGAGFVKNSDLTFDHNKPGLKPGAQLFEADVFKSNIAQWAWDFHDHFMARKGASEDKFDDLIAKMPRNMAALIAFLNHNRARVQRDAETLDKPVGLAAEGNKALGDNAGAALVALKDAIEQFAAAVTSPAMKTVGSVLQDLAQRMQNAAKAYGEFAKANPTASGWLGGGAMAGGALAGGWLTLKLLSGFGNVLAGGGSLTGAAGALTGAAAALDAAAARLGGSAAAGAASSTAAAGGGFFAGLWKGLGGALKMGGPMAMIAGLGTLTTPEEDKVIQAAIDRENAEAALKAAPLTNALQRRALDPEVERMVDADYAARKRGAPENSPEAMRGRALGDLKVSLDPNSKVDVGVRVEPSSELLRVIASAKASGNASVGVSSAGVAPNGQGGIGRR